VKVTGRPCSSASMVRRAWRGCGRTGRAGPPAACAFPPPAGRRPG